MGEEVGFDEGRPDFSGKKTEVIGNLSFKFDHDDHYASPHRNGTTIMYISYLKSLKIDKDSLVVKYITPFNIPGDLSLQAKDKGMSIPLKRVVLSEANILLLVLIPIATIAVVVLGRAIRSIKGRRI